MMNASIKLIPKGNNVWEIVDGNPVFHKNTGAHVLTFDIVNNNTGKDITFDQDPIWAQMGSKPGNTKPVKGADKGQIAGDYRILNDGHQLVVVDWNSEAGPIHYKLFFKNYGPTDPIIENGGGVKPPSGRIDTAQYAAYIGVGLVALFAGMLLHRLFFARRTKGAR